MTVAGEKQTNHVPTDRLRKQVESDAEMQLTDDDIAYLLGISEKTLKRHYREELKRGRIKFKRHIGGTLRRLLDQDHAATAIFCGKTRLGMKETSVNEISAGEGGALKEVRVTFVEPENDETE